MRRLFFCGLLAGFLFVGCTTRGEGLAADDSIEYITCTPEVATPAPPTTSASTLPPPTLASLPIGMHRLANPTFTNRYAITDGYFFIIDYTWGRSTRLIRLPLDDISNAQIIPVPGFGSMDIIGLCARYLHISRTTGVRWDNTNDMHVVYRIALETLEVQDVAQIYAFSTPFYHESTHSLLALREGQNETTRYVMSYDLHTNRWSYLYEFESFGIYGRQEWVQVQSGAVVFTIHAFSVHGGWAVFFMAGDCIYILITNWTHCGWKIARCFMHGTPILRHKMPWRNI